MSLYNNQPCWCGSGYRFKRCHGKFVRMKPLSFSRVTSTKSRPDRNKCYHPDSPAGCLGRPISSHTLQRSGALRQISEQSHVYSFYAPGKIGNDFANDIDPVKRGVRQASTFPGFCNEHDSNMFKPIETKPLAPDVEQCFLMHYRAVAFEYWCKKHGKIENTVIDLICRGKDYNEQREMASFIRNFNESVDLGIEDVKHEFNIIKQHYINNHFDDIRGIAINLSGATCLCASSCFTPTPTWRGEDTIDLRDQAKRADRVVANLIPTDMNMAIFALTWDAEASPNGEKYAQCILDAETTFIPHGIFQTILDNVENIHFRPSWWDGLDTDNKKYIRNRFLGELLYRSGNLVKPDGYEIVNWSTDSIVKIGW